MLKIEYDGRNASLHADHVHALAMTIGGRDHVRFSIHDIPRDEFDALPGDRIAFDGGVSAELRIGNAVIICFLAAADVAAWREVEIL